MAIHPNALYPTKTAAPNAAYPFGGAQNITVSGDGTGTPWTKAILNDIFGLQQAILSEAGITPSGSPDTVTASQYLDGLKALFLEKAGGVMAGGIDMDGNELTGVPDPMTDPDAANKLYVDTSTGGTVIQTIDLTNGAANDLQFVKVTPSAAWDEWDFIGIRVRGATVSGATQFAFLCEVAASPETFLTVNNGTYEGLTASSASFTVGETLSLNSRLRNFGGGQMSVFHDAAVAGTDVLNSNDSGPSIGFAIQYSASKVFGGHTNIANWTGWDLGTPQWTDAHNLWFSLTSGVTFTGGTLEVFGRNW